MTGELNAKHVDWKLRLPTTRGSLLLDFAYRKTCFIYGRYSPTNIPYNQSAIPDVIST